MRQIKSQKKNIHYNDVNNHGRQIEHTNHNGRQHMTKYWSDSISP